MQEEMKFKALKDRFKFIVQCNEEKEKHIDINVDDIMPNPYQPRRYFDVKGLEELADSIKQVGIITPVTVRRAPGGFELVCGERRVRAAKMAGLEKIPAIIVEMSDKDSAIIAITENLQRKDLNFFEEAESMQNLIEFHSLTQEDVAEKLGKSQAAVANKLRLLKLPESVRRIVNENNLCERHARAFLRLPTEELKIAAAKRTAELQLNVASTERMVQKMLEEEPKLKMMKRNSLSFEKTGRLFKNTLHKTVEMLKKGGVTPSITEREEDDYIEFVIKLEKN
ncbi:MAG: ParB/RepB/Spo0J family partition protein [Clostridia bacterium]